MSKYQPYMEINNNYGWDNNDFMLYPNEITYNQNKEIVKNNNKTTNLNNNIISHKINNICNNNKSIKKKEKLNDFPMAWTCYKNNEGNWICPLRGD